MNYVYVYHSKSNIHGIGVFINDDVEKGQTLGVSHASYNGIWYMTTHGYYNHSENPNCRIEVEGNITIMIAKRKILHGEELTVDYRDQPFLEQPKKDWVK